MGYASRTTNKAYKIPTKLEMASIVLVLNYIKILGHIRIDHKELVSGCMSCSGQSKGHDDDIYYFATLENKLNEVGITLSV